MDNVNVLLEHLSVFKNLYEMVRIVDPINKRVIIDNKGYIPTVGNCFDLWKSKSYCSNCISMRAYNEENTFVKIEYNKEKIYMVIASPFNIGTNKYILELLKDITDCSIIENYVNKTVDEVQKIIEEMNNKIIKDELTGIYNKRYINERLPIDIIKNSNEKNSFSILMTDIDHFKFVNDNYGHLAGDKILVDFAYILSKSIREGIDWVARYGGEEFIIVLNYADNSIAYEIAEKIRRSIENNIFTYEGQEIKITASFGICTMPNDDMDWKANDMILLAD
ncbi:MULTISPECIES: GGDEF domain-containing protein [Anaerotignum]|uniref:Diguanylate cyclase VdcA n=2 Tax=Anaerotignum TaxID=2039240 RepID=A0A136WGV4_9FIRM|nr:MULTISPECIES: GGDEF domain-containing protein [Anaerotignum]KXL53697.1 diguanylate cyclase VdcA [Anaerotignum neopropionicum]